MKFLIRNKRFNLTITDKSPEKFKDVEIDFDASNMHYKIIKNGKTLKSVSFEDWYDINKISASVASNLGDQQVFFDTPDDEIIKEISTFGPYNQ